LRCLNTELDDSEWITVAILDDHGVPGIAGCWVVEFSGKPRLDSISDAALSITVPRWKLILWIVKVAGEHSA